MRLKASRMKHTTNIVAFRTHASSNTPRLAGSDHQKPSQMRYLVAAILSGWCRKTKIEPRTLMHPSLAYVSLFAFAVSCFSGK